jgi:hypothetical protein
MDISIHKHTHKPSVSFKAKSVSGREILLRLRTSVQKAAVLSCIIDVRTREAGLRASDDQQERQVLLVGVHTQLF